MINIKFINHNLTEQNIVRIVTLAIGYQSAYQLSTYRNIIQQYEPIKKNEPVPMKMCTRTEVPRTGTGPSLMEK